jgi:uncharacterized iron-regulated membrane protein
LKITSGGLRGLWLQVHSWLGVALFVVLIPLGLTGSMLMVRESLERMSHPARYAVTAGAQPASLEAYAASARGAAGPERRLNAIRLPDGPGKPVIAILTGPKPATPGGRPPQQAVWLDPVSARVLDQGPTMSGVTRFAHDFHGQLLVPPMGRKLVGWLGWVMLVSSLTGIWLWWPRNGNLARGFRWRRTALVSANLHHLTGLIVAIPLAVLSATGIWISFPDSARALTGQATSAARPRDGGDRGGAAPLQITRLTADQALVAARSLSADGKLSAINWPGEKRPVWRLQFAGRTGATPSEIQVDDRTGAAKASRSGAGGADPVARLMRRLHEGEGLTPVWTVLVFLTGLAPTMLGLTGVWMYLRRRRTHAASARAI